MKKINPFKNSEKCNLSEDNETDDDQQYVKNVEDIRSLVVTTDKLRNYLPTERSLLHRYNNDSDSDSLPKVQYNENSKNICKYCGNDCPLVMNGIDEQQISMLCTYNTPSSNHFKQLDHFTHDSETDRKHLELWQTAQNEYYSKLCKYCKEYGHLEDKCVVLEKATHRQPEGDWRDIETTKSRRSKKNKTLKTEVHDLSEIDYSASGCDKETKENYFSKYCHYCKEYGHIENICPLDQNALKKQKEKPIKILPKINKKDKSDNFTSATVKVKDTRKLKTCNFCENSDHKEYDCPEKKQYEYLKKQGRHYKEQIQLKDMCPSLDENIKELENDEFYLNGQMAANDLNSKIKFKHVKTSNKCNFFGDCDHNKSEYEEKLQYDYIGKYCACCVEYDQFKDAHLLDEQGAKEMKNQSYCEVSPKSSKRVTFLSAVTTITDDLRALKICRTCDEFGHNEIDCFVRQQAEFYSKYCDYCKENGHYKNDCVLNKQSFNNSTFASICSEHYICENCHTVYSHKANNSKSEKPAPKNARKTTLKSSLEANAYKLRYCTLCGIEGLVDTCILKERAAIE